MPGERSKVSFPKAQNPGLGEVPGILGRIRLEE